MLVPIPDLKPDTKANPEETARATTDKFLADLNTLNSRFEETEAWANEMDKTVVYLTHAQKGLTNAQLYALALTKRRWDKIPASFRIPYNNDFWFYACLRTGRQMKRLQELIDMIEVFVLDGTKPFSSIEVPKRDEHGNIIPGEVEHKVFDPMDTDSGKLVALRNKAANGEMTQKLWAMLVDEQISVTEIQAELLGNNGGGGDTTPVDRSMKFRFEGPILTAHENGIVVELGEITAWDEYYDNPRSLEHRAIKRLMAMLNMKADEEIILQQNLRKRRTNGNYPDSQNDATEGRE